MLLAGSGLISTQFGNFKKNKNKKKTLPATMGGQNHTKQGAPFTPLTQCYPGFYTKRQYTQALARCCALGGDQGD